MNSIPMLLCVSSYVWFTDFRHIIASTLSTIFVSAGGKQEEWSQGRIRPQTPSVAINPSSLVHSLQHGGLICRILRHPHSLRCDKLHRSGGLEYSSFGMKLNWAHRHRDSMRYCTDMYDCWCYTTWGGEKSMNQYTNAQTVDVRYLTYGWSTPRGNRKYRAFDRWDGCINRQHSSPPNAASSGSKHRSKSCSTHFHLFLTPVSPKSWFTTPSWNGSVYFQPTTYVV